jgi:hypothetical protein
MQKDGLKWLRFSMVALMLLTTCAVSWTLFADIKTTELNTGNQDLSAMGDLNPSSRLDSPHFTGKRNKQQLAAAQGHLGNSSKSKNHLTEQAGQSIPGLQGFAGKATSAYTELQTSQIPSSERQGTEVPDYSGLIASISEVTGYSIPLQPEFLYPLEEIGLFADISHGQSPSEPGKSSEKSPHPAANPQMQQKQHGLVIESSEQDGIKVEDAWHDGVNVVKAHRGLNVGRAYGRGVNVGFAHDDGVYVDSADMNGMDIDHVGDDGIQIFRAGKDGLVIYNAAEEGIDAIGNRGNLLRTNNPDFYGLYVYSYGALPSNPGLYVAGTFYATGTKSSVVRTSRGHEALYAMESPEVEFVASGTAQLSNGECYVTFDRLFREATSREIPLRIILTPKDTWTGLYVTEKSYQGFQVRAVGGAMNAEFDWLAIGRRKGYEKTPDSPFLNK